MVTAFAKTVRNDLFAILGLIAVLVQSVQQALKLMGVLDPLTRVTIVVVKEERRGEGVRQAREEVPIGAFI